MINTKEKLFQEELQHDGSRFTKLEKELQDEALILERMMSLRLRGDLYRYLSELGSGFEAKSSRELALKSY